MDIGYGLSRPEHVHVRPWVDVSVDINYECHDALDHLGVDLEMAEERGGGVNFHLHGCCMIAGTLSFATSSHKMLLLSLRITAIYYNNTFEYVHNGQSWKSTRGCRRG